MSPRDGLGPSRRSIFGGGVALAAGGMPALASADGAAASGAVKCTEFFRRAPGLTREAFLEHWRGVREPLVRRLPGLIRTTFNTINRTYTPDAPYDGVLELWFENAAAYAAALEGADPAVAGPLRRDAAIFRADEFLGMQNREVVVREVDRDRPWPEAKRIGLVGRQPDMSRAEFVRSWREDHAPAVLQEHGLERYVLNIFEEGRFPDSPWDGYAELWWTDWPTYEVAFREYQKARAGRSSSFFYNHLLLMVDEHRSV